MRRNRWKVWRGICHRSHLYAAKRLLREPFSRSENGCSSPGDEQPCKHGLWVTGQG